MSALDGKRYAFIVGAPRSGTTILEQVVGAHPDVAHWYQPYYIWNFHTGHLDSDARTLSDLSDKAIAFIRREFDIFFRKS